MKDDIVLLVLIYLVSYDFTVNSPKMVLDGNATHDPELQKSKSNKVLYIGWR